MEEETIKAIWAIIATLFACIGAIHIARKRYKENEHNNNTPRERNNDNERT